jgi:tetratricopeptide (TPR) repeat protein
MSAYAGFYKKLRTKTVLFYVFCTFCIGVVEANIIYSQKYNQNMYGVMRGEGGSIIVYLKHILGSPLFNQEIKAYEVEGRMDILSQWAIVQGENNEKIQSLENAMRLYPNSPELYYNLHLLYLENGDKVKANENLKKARQIDPSI